MYVWRRERLPTPVLWPGEFHGLYSPWGHKESDTTEQLFHFHFTSVYVVHMTTIKQSGEDKGSYYDDTVLHVT